MCACYRDDHGAGVFKEEKVMGTEFKKVTPFISGVWTLHPDGQAAGKAFVANSRIITDGLPVGSQKSCSEFSEM